MTALVALEILFFAKLNREIGTTEEHYLYFDIKRGTGSIPVAVINETKNIDYRSERKSLYLLTLLVLRSCGVNGQHAKIF